MYSTIDVDESATLPHAFIAHQQAVDLILVAIISTHPDPERVMRKFRTLISQLTAATPQQVLDSSSFVAAVRRSATRIDVMVERLLPAMIATQESTPASLLVPETRPDR